MVDIVNQIRSAEEEADEIKRAARQRARQLRDDAEASGKLLLETERRQAEEQVDALLSDAQAKAAACLEVWSGRSAQECAELFAKAQVGVDRAATFIVERIVGGL